METRQLRTLPLVGLFLRDLGKTDRVRVFFIFFFSPPGTSSLADRFVLVNTRMIALTIVITIRGEDMRRAIFAWICVG